MGKESLMLYLTELVESPLKILLTVNKHQVYLVGYSHFTPEACRILKSDLSSLDFVVNRLFIKLFKPVI